MNDKPATTILIDADDIEAIEYAAEGEHIQSHHPAADWRTCTQWPCPTLAALLP